MQENQQLADLIVAESAQSERFLVGIAGPPAAGKSTLAADLHQRLASQQSFGVAAVPMDGFHLDDRILQEQGLLAVKGAPRTFDVHGFYVLCERLCRADEAVYYPVFDRDHEYSRAAAACVLQSDKVVIVEGNYLLLDEPPWSALADLFDLTVYLEVNEQELTSRLLQRWRDQGLDEPAANARAMENDLPNARVIQTLSKTADITLRV